MGAHMHRSVRLVWLLGIFAGCQNTKGSIDEPVPDTIKETGDGDSDGDGFVDDDCDDGNPDVNPGAQEVPYNGIDDDCDPLTPDDDLDGDGFGIDEDCNDGDEAINPSADEVWYDGEDQDCDGADDYDQDGDGDRAIAHGGEDCDDTDSARYGGVDCRPQTDAIHPGADTLNTDLAKSFSDLIYDADGVLYLCTLISGMDYVYIYEDSKHTETLNGYSNWNMNAIALDTNSSNEVIVGYIASRLGYESSSTISPFSSGSGPTGGAYSNSYMRAAPNSIAVDSTGCIWVTNFGGAGSLSCVLSDETREDYTVGSAYLDAVDIDSEGTIHVIEGDQILAFEPSSETSTVVYTAKTNILDFVFDFNDDIYLETAGDELWLIEPDGAETLLDTISGDGRLAIHPAGVLIRMQANPVAASSFQDWTLD